VPRPQTQMLQSAQSFLSSWGKEVSAVGRLLVLASKRSHQPGRATDSTPAAILDACRGRLGFSKLLLPAAILDASRGRLGFSELWLRFCTAACGSVQDCWHKIGELVHGWVGADLKYWVGLGTKQLNQVEAEQRCEAVHATLLDPLRKSK